MNNKKVYLYIKRIFIIILTFWFVIFFIPHCFRWCVVTILGYSHAHQMYLLDYEMNVSDIRDTLKYNRINLEICDLKGIRNSPNYPEDDFLGISFKFKCKNFQTITNKLVKAWISNKNHLRLTWNESSKWEILKEPMEINIANKNIIKLTFPKGSLNYNCNSGDAVRSIIINTNNMECLFSERKL